MGEQEEIFQRVPVDKPDSMQFSEADNGWREVPAWVRFMLESGWQWVDSGSEGRKIGLITTPCDSAAAGLIALGAVSYRLREVGANDLDTHFARLVAAAKRPGSRVVLRRDGRRCRYMPDGEFEPGKIWVRELDTEQKGRVTVAREKAGEWWVCGEARVEVHKGTGLQGADIYNGLFPAESPVHMPNLSWSDSFLCLAGPARGQDSARRSYSSVRFRMRNESLGLHTLLSVQDWCPTRISRLAYYNPFTERSDRDVSGTRFVIADGCDTFLNVLDREEFSQANVLAVVPRTLDRDRLESIASKLTDLKQWYQLAVKSKFPSAVPPGITLSVIERRHQ